MRALIFLTASLGSTEPNFCTDAPTHDSQSASAGRPSHGRLQGAARFLDSEAARIMPLRHAARCIRFATARLVLAIAHTAERVQALIPNSPALGVGDLSRASGGPISPYSRSHQSGRDADLAFYARDVSGAPVAATDLHAYSDKLVSNDGSLHFDVERNWQMVAGLLEDASIHVQWLFVTPAIAHALVAEGERVGAPSALLARATAVLHQPSDARPHNDHMHVRILCEADERRLGCLD